MTRALSLAVFLSVAISPSALRAQAVEVINEDFEGVDPGVGEVPDGVNPVCAGDACGFNLPQVMSDGCDNNVLVLTDGRNSEGSWIWFDDQFDLNATRVEIEFDLFIGRGASATPADGVSVIFQFDSDVNATGATGGGMGIGNFRGNASEYIAVSFDIWDNGAADPETPVDGRYGGPSTASIEVNQNNVQPWTVTPLAESARSPDFIASADIYGTPPNRPGSCDPDDLVHISIVFDNRLMLVKARGPAADTDPTMPFEEQIVVNTSTDPFPDRLTNIGFAASTGGANAWQWIDNVVVREQDSLVSISEEDRLTTGAINCAGPAVDASDEIGVEFRADAFFGGELSREGDIDTGLTIITSRFGRIELGADFTNSNPRSIDVSSIAGAGDETARVFATDAFSPIGVLYRAVVQPGRYDVTLYWSENFVGAVNGAGQGTKLYDVVLNGESVLCSWSAAAAAGSGNGDASATCVARLDRAVARTFSVDVADAGGGAGTLEVLVDDLGGGNPPEQAALNALSFSRTGDVTGDAASGDTECDRGDPSPPPAGVLIERDFEDDNEAECPAEMTCNTNNIFAPQVVLDEVAGDQRLRLVEDFTGSTATTAIFNQTVNVRDFSLTAEFDVFMANPDGGTIADGGTFFVLEGNNVNALGGSGGAMAVPTNAYGFVVEFDTWNNGGTTGDSSGFNPGSATPWTHVGINNMSIESTVTNSSFDPDLRPVSAGGAGWPDFFDPEGVQVIVEYNRGQVSVTLEGRTEEGEAFGPTVVAEAFVPPILTPEAVVGFSGGTGGATQHLDFDNVVIRAAEGEPGGPEFEAIESARARWADGRGELYINCGGPTLSCSATQNPAPGATGDGGVGERVVWLGDLRGGGSIDPFAGEFFTVDSLPNRDGSNTGLQVQPITNMGNWDARGTEPGVDQNDAIFHTERYADMLYELPVIRGERYQLTLFFANSFSGTSGTARRFFHVEIDGEQQGGFEHCQSSGRNGPAPTPNPVFGFDNLYDPVDHAEQLYSPDPCNFAACDDNGVGVRNDPDADRITAERECGNAAATALRFEITPQADTVEIRLTEPDALAGEPVSPDGNPKISGISLRNVGGPQRVLFKRGDTTGDGVLNITDAVKIFGVLFLGDPAPGCQETMDVNNDRAVNITDGIRILGFLFLGQEAPVAPGHETCGPDPDAPGSPGDIGCETYDPGNC